MNVCSIWPFAQISDDFYYLGIWQRARYFVAALFKELALIVRNVRSGVSVSSRILARSRSRRLRSRLHHCQLGQIRSQCHPEKMNCCCKRLLFSTKSTTMRQLFLQTILAKIDPNRLGFINILLLCFKKRIEIFFLLGMKSGTGWSIWWKLMRHFGTHSAGSVVDACFNSKGDVLTKPSY